MGGSTRDRLRVVERLVSDRLLRESENHRVGKRPGRSLGIGPQVPLRPGARLDGAAVAQKALARPQRSETVALREGGDACVEVLPAPGRERVHTVDLVHPDQVTTQGDRERDEESAKPHDTRSTADEKDDHGDDHHEAEELDESGCGSQETRGSAGESRRAVPRPHEHEQRCGDEDGEQRVRQEAMLDACEQRREAERHDCEGGEPPDHSQVHEKRVEQTGQRKQENVLDEDDLSVAEPLAGQPEETGVSPRVRLTRTNSPRSSDVPTRSRNPKERVVGEEDQTAERRTGAQHDDRQAVLGKGVDEKARNAGPARSVLRLRLCRFAASPVAPPRSQKRAPVAQAVQQVVSLLALAGRSLVHDDRALGDAIALADRPYEQLRRLVLRFFLPHRVRDLDDECADAARGVRDVRAGQQSYDERKNAHTRLAKRIVGLRPAEHPRAEDEIGFVGEDRLEQAGDVRRIPLTVRVEGDDVLRAVLAGEPIPEPKRSSLPRVLFESGDVDTGIPCHSRSAVDAAVVDYESVDGQTACLARRVVEYGADRVFLVEGGNDDDDGGEAKIRVALAERAHRSLTRILRRRDSRALDGRGLRGTSHIISHRGTRRFSSSGSSLVRGIVAHQRTPNRAQPGRLAPRP